MNFYDFYNKIQGEPDNTPEPDQYKLANYMDLISNSGEEYGGSELKPLTIDDMSQVSEKDRNDWLLKYGKNTTKLGDPLDDEGMKKYTGIW